jgi:DNA-binding beta-propeller fold protein YncE
VRALFCLSVAIVACTRSDANPSPPPATQVAASTFVGPDALFLRIPRTGGQVRVVAFPNVDSTIWTSTARSPAPGRVLGFDDDAGMVAIADAKGHPARIDLRRDSIETPLREGLLAPVSLDGSAIYGVTAKGVVVRTTPAGEWRYSGPHPARGVLPLRDGSVLIWSEREGQTVLTRVKPPAMTPVDSLTMPAAELAAGTGVGDRLYFSAGPRLYAVQTRTLALDAPIPVGGEVSAIAVTPSGDHIYALATADEHSTVVAVDRYHWRISSQIPLDTKARELRVDPIGRYVLVRSGKDSVLVVAVATNTVIGTVRSDWRDDLPLVAPDGSIVTARDGDVLFVRPEDQRLVSRIGGGASDFWFPFWWTGFRPRAASLDVPVTFDSMSAVADSAARASVATSDSAQIAPTVLDSAPPKPAGFTVSFFALLSEQRAQSEAAKIHVGTDAARVETVMRNGIPVYRVILGPFPTCADAQRAARASGKTVWIPEGGCEVPPPENEPLAR